MNSEFQEAASRWMSAMGARRLAGYVPTAVELMNDVFSRIQAAAKAGGRTIIVDAKDWPTDTAVADQMRALGYRVDIHPTPVEGLYTVGPFTEVSW